MAPHSRQGVLAFSQSHSRALRLRNLVSSGTKAVKKNVIRGNRRRAACTKRDLRGPRAHPRTDLDDARTHVDLLRRLAQKRTDFTAPRAWNVRALVFEVPFVQFL